MIEIRGLEKSYGEIHALRGFDLAAGDGQITTLLGANGSGKTTTLRALAGLIDADAGSIAIDGVAVPERRQAARARLGFLPDRFGLYPRLTGREHVEYFGRMRGLRGAALRSAVDETVDLLAMHDIAVRRTAGFSHGQRVKVALGQVLVGGPQNLVLDEPTRGLDVFSVRLLRRVLRTLRDAGRCILLSTHVMAEVEGLSDRVIVIAGGRTAAAGGVDELLAQTRTDALEEAFVTLAQIEGGQAHAG